MNEKVYIVYKTINDLEGNLIDAELSKLFYYLSDAEKFVSEQDGAYTIVDYEIE